MSMTQLVLGCALGFLVAQGILHGVRLVFTRNRRRRASDADAKSIPSSYIRAFIRYAAPVGASAAFVMLGAWTVQDYLSARTAHVAVVEQTDPLNAPDQAGSATTTAAAAPASDADAEAPDTPAVNPYTDPDFRVAHRARGPLSLKDQLVQRSEQKARAELLHETKQRASRSQYDCERPSCREVREGGPTCPTRHSKYFR
jgi:hypothetical protein